MSEVVIFNPNDEQAVPITWDGLGALTISSVAYDALVDATVKIGRASCRERV